MKEMCCQVPWLGKVFIYGPNAYLYFYERGELPDEPCESCEMFHEGKWWTIYRKTDHEQGENN